MKKLICILMMFILCLQYNYAGHLDRRDNTKLIEYLKTVCNDKLGEYDYYQGSKMVKIGFYDYSYFFVDMQPGAGWEHPCKHLYCRAASPLFSADTLIVYDGMRPLPNADLIPLSVKDRYGSKSKLKAKVAKLPVNAGNQNKFSGNTYAVILSGGMNKDANEERYWNDCSFLYQTLRNHYNISRKNIKVIMADGTDPAADMKTVDNEYISSPLDLDGDGTSDIDFAATRENVASVIKELSSKMTDKDHLLLFVVDHGGYDKQKQQSYICLWGDAKLYPDELNDCLKAGDAGYVSIVMGQCHSGGFVESLKGNNRVIATACAENELSFGNEDIPFDEFVYRWTSALNGYDAEGNKVAEVQNAHGFTTITDAARYAQKQDMYTDGKFPYAEETPQLSWLTNSTAEDLALDTIPPTVYLCITEGSSSKPLSFSRYPKEKLVAAGQYFWNSSDIWLRNQDDGIENQKHENPDISESKRDFYVYTKVRNKGVKPYSGKGWSLASWWAESSVIITRDVWQAKYVNSKDMPAGQIDDEYIEEPIAPGDSIVIGYKGKIDNKNFKKMNPGKKHICLLSCVFEDEAPSVMDGNDDDYVLSVWNTDRMAQCNRINVDMKAVDNADFDIIFFDPSKVATSYTIALDASGGSESTMNKVRMKMALPQNQIQTWKENGAKCIDAKFDNNGDNTILLSSDTSVVADISTIPMKKEKLSFRFNRLAKESVLETCYRQINVAAFNTETGQCLGGETFVVELSPRQAITPEIKKELNADGTYTLTAANITEDVAYEWHDEKGNVIGTGRSVTVPANSSNIEYTVEVTAKSDAAISNATMTVERIPLISGIETTTDGARVNFSAPMKKGTTARVLSATDNNQNYEYILDNNARSSFLPMSQSSTGIYQLMLVEEGKVIETRKFLK